MWPLPGLRVAFLVQSRRGSLKQPKGVRPPATCYCVHALRVQRAGRKDGGYRFAGAPRPDRGSPRPVYVRRRRCRVAGAPLSPPLSA